MQDTVAAPPCSTYSIARYFKSKDSKDGGPAPVRSRSEILGLSDVNAQHQRELRQANEITRRTCVLLSAARRSGAEIAIENPADRGDPSQPHLFQFPEHGPLWLDPHVITLISEASMRSATFAQCMFGGSAQKYTTFYFTAGFDSSFSPLNRLLCTHAPGTHGTVAGGAKVDEKWSSAATAAYPADLNLLIAEAILHLSTSTVTTPPVASIRPPTETPATVAPDAEPNIAIADDAIDADAAADDASPAPRTDAPPLAAPRTVAARDTEAPPSGNRRRRQARDVFQRGLGAIQTRSRGTAALARPSATDPSNRPAAMVDDKPGWTKAEVKEIDNHQGNHSWSYIPLNQKPRDRRTVRLIWVYKTKRDGTKKARLCVQGCTQVPGVDYDQTFCAAMRGTSLRLLCALSARLKLKMRRWDFVAAYLQGELEEGEVVYCSPPTGYETKKLANGTIALCEKGDGDGVTRLCKVEKPVYGMAQAGRRWQRSLFPWMLAWRCDAKGAKGCAHRPAPLNADANATSADTDPTDVRLYQTDADTCVFYTEATMSTPSGMRHEYLFVGVYVDDLFILSSHDDEHSLYHFFTRDLAAAWDVEDEGEVDDLLSIEISSKDGHVSLTQTGYIEKLMKTYGPASGLPPSSHRRSATPCDHTLAQTVCDALVQETADIDAVLLKRYQSLCGALLYTATNTRPDVAYAVGMHCRAMGRPTEELYESALRILYYLWWTRHLGLRYEGDELDLYGMSDSDWATKHSTTGWLFMYSQACISWGSKKQNSVALSSCEAEIMALSEASKEGVYLDRFLVEVGLPASSTVSLATDNTGARDLAYNPEHHDRTKHIERRHFFIRELVEEQRIVVPYVNTADNLADFFTKALAAKTFYQLRNKIMNIDRSRSEPLPALTSSARDALPSDSLDPSPGGCSDGIDTACEHGGVLDYTPARDPASGIRTGPDVRTDPDVRTVPDVTIAASDTAHEHGGALHVAHVQDPSSMPQSSPSVAAATLGTDIRSHPRVNQPGP